MHLPFWFTEYLAPGSDRPTILIGALNAAGIKAREVNLSGARHVIAFPKNNRRSPAYRTKIITAHHDRVAGTQGALDNSAAALQLVDFLARDEAAFNTCVIFTDHEELGSALPTDQGSYALGRAFSTLGFNAPVIFSLDVCGRGDTLLLSSATDSLLHREHGMEKLAAQVDATATQLLNKLRGHADQTVAMARRAKVPFGEDLGFLCAGQASLVLTVLPGNEVGRLPADTNLPPWAAVSRPVMPETWAVLHGSGDTVELYEERAFRLMGLVLELLASWKIKRVQKE